MTRAKINLTAFILSTRRGRDVTWGEMLEAGKGARL